MKYDIGELCTDEELKESLHLVKRVFDKFEAPYYSKEGVESFYKFIEYDSMKERLNDNMKMLIAKKENKIIGVIAFRDKSHISMLFVDNEYHKQGIGSTLLKYAIFDCTYHENTDKVTVNSSPYAIEFYRKQDFEEIGDEQIVDGIKFTPMALLTI